MQTFSDNSSLFRFYSSNMNLLLAYLCYMITNFIEPYHEEHEKLTFKLACFFLSLLVSSVAMAESITSPNGLLKLNVSVNEKGEPVYELSYKGKEVIKPSKLGLELKDDPGLMDGFTLSDAKTSSFDETWEPVWGEVKQIRNNYNELAITLDQKAQDRKW